MIEFDGFNYLNSLLPLKTFHKNPQLRLERLALILEKIGNPQKKVATIHIAGSKGKGSTAGYIASILQEIGYRVALFTSPHVNHLKERLLLNGTPLDDSYWHKALHQLHAASSGLAIEAARPEPTYFEALTLAAFYAADELKVDYLVLETGIGGRLDPTNLCCPVATVITPIELEHTDILGNSLTLIAHEKAGIIKEGVPVFCSRQKEVVRQVIKEQAVKASADFFYLDDFVSHQQYHYSKKDYTMKGSFIYKSQKIESSFAMIGHKQLENAALALLTINSLYNDDLQCFKAYHQAVAQLALPMRMQVLRHEPLVVIDAAHTYESLKSSIELFSLLSGGQSIIIFSCSDDKELGGMMALFGSFSHIIMCALGEKNRLTAKKNYEMVKNSYPNTSFITQPVEALSIALQYNRDLLITGSFYFSNYLGLERFGLG